MPVERRSHDVHPLAGDERNRRRRHCRTVVGAAADHRRGLHLGPPGGGGRAVLLRLLGGRRVGVLVARQPHPDLGDLGEVALRPRLVRLLQVQVRVRGRHHQIRGGASSESMADLTTSASPRPWVAVQGR